MRRIAILTPDPADEGYRTRWRDVLESNAAPLRAAGLDVEGRSWTEEGGDWSGFDLILPLLAWGYPRAHGQWVDTTAAWERAGLPVANPPPVLRWNSDKLYLGRLAERGAPVVPTLYVERIDVEALLAAAAHFGTDRLVAKPQVSSTAWQTIRWSPGAPLEGGPASAAMIQPYMEGIERTGETSLLYFGGRFSHAIGKLPRPGEFRVQPEYHGVITRYDPAPDELAAAGLILSAIDEPLLYARIDLVRGPGGEPLLIELELIEPDLYVGYDPAAGAAFAAAVKERIAD
jgi:hypothetical protein